MRILRSFVVIAILVELQQPIIGNSALAFQQPAAAQQKDGSVVFTERVAAGLLDQVKQGLEGHMAKKTLDSFDLSRMGGGAAFKNQIAAFLNQYESIRFRFNLLETSTNGAEATAVVDVEMEENLPGDVSAPIHKHAQLRFVAQNSPKGWKFTGVEPRSFFS
jgi:hypothetical protein